MSSEGIVSVIQQFLDSYRTRTPTKLKLVDAYLAYIMMTGIVQFVYCALVGTFPFNSFLSGFISCVGSFVLGGDCAISVADTGLMSESHTYMPGSKFPLSHMQCL